MRPKLDLPNCLAILRACSRRPRTVAELMRTTGLSRPTLYRTLADLRVQLRADIACVEGRYIVTGWGIIDRERV
mgnify:CR=1 FL=1